MERQSRYLKGYSCFNYVMSSEAVCFVMHLLDVKYLHDKGYNICWTQEEYIERMGMGRNPFLGCLYELNRIGLLVDTLDETGERVTYTLNMPAYDKLVKICGATYNSQRLKEFLQYGKEDRTQAERHPRQGDHPFGVGFRKGRQGSPVCQVLHRLLLRVEPGRDLPVDAHGGH